jgi:hypothetical protein
LRAESVPYANVMRAGAAAIHRPPLTTCWTVEFENLKASGAGTNVNDCRRSAGVLGYFD